MIGFCRMNGRTVGVVGNQPLEAAGLYLRTLNRIGMNIETNLASKNGSLLQKH